MKLREPDKLSTRNLLIRAAVVLLSLGGGYLIVDLTPEGHWSAPIGILLMLTGIVGIRYVVASLLRLELLWSTRGYSTGWRP
jgi:hypothetical protein